MEINKKSLTKLCSFYVSDWHLVTMMLPYINQKVNEKAKIATILEKDIKENVVILVEKLNLKNKEEILNVNWHKNENIKRQSNELKDNQEFLILINGDENFIENQNKKIEKYFNTHLIKNTIKIVNFYDVTKLKGSISKILENHDKILNTSGEKEISEVIENKIEQEKRLAM